MEKNLNNDMTIGIPRAMSFYHNYPFYYGFFTDLGIKIVLSDMTTKQTMSRGSSLVVTETCLPIKVYIGHVLNLIDKGVDKIFVPSIQSIAPKIYNCSKIRGLPDLVRNVVKKDFTMIEATLDKSEKNQGIYEFLKEMVAPFGITDMERIKKASKAGWRTYNNFHIMSKSGMSYKKAMNYALQGKVFIENQTKVYSSLQLSNEQMDDGIKALGQEMYWANEREMTGAAGHYLKDTKIDGLITLTAFGCGPDSLMIERITRQAKRFNKPLLNLTVDEQTGEAGFITRLEAFVDMLFRKKRAKIINKIEINGENTYIPNTNYIETTQER